MFEIFQSEKNSKFYFNLKAKNGQIILASQAYDSKAGVNNGIASVRENSTDDSKYERKTVTNGKFHFVLKSGNGQVIGTSQMYASEAGMENGIESVKNHASTTSVKEVKK